MDGTLSSIDPPVCNAFIIRVIDLVRTIVSVLKWLLLLYLVLALILVLFPRCSSITPSSQIRVLITGGILEGVPNVWLCIPPKGFFRRCWLVLCWPPPPPVPPLSPLPPPDPVSYRWFCGKNRSIENEFRVVLLLLFLFFFRIFRTCLLIFLWLLSSFFLPKGNMINTNAVRSIGIPLFLN